ncbi:hypothetical protein PoB_001776400 [Plakobranchus ocellatus]|uniref:Uncharacterized protein n=1 Tax=Plakobranchus ocellatus TaxID=259542 RepID=A0AAV3Z7E9_9GAST|nr:hypothetical protein PoB_001776400 [Plakobranchus ocellatus]
MAGLEPATEGSLQISGGLANHYATDARPRKTLMIPDFVQSGLQAGIEPAREMLLRALCHRGLSGSKYGASRNGKTARSNGDIVRNLTTSYNGDVLATAQTRQRVEGWQVRDSQTSIQSAGARPGRQQGCEHEGQQGLDQADNRGVTVSRG